MRRLLGITFVLAMLLAVFPFLSVARLSNEVLAMAPVTEHLARTEVSTFAVFDDEFILGTATYVGTSAAAIERDFAAAGFTEQWFQGASGTWRARPCCGGYDAALVQVNEASDGTVNVVFSAADGDIVLAWPFFAVPGLATGLAAALLLLRSRNNRRRREPAGQPALRSAITPPQSSGLPEYGA